MPAVRNPRRVKDGGGALPVVDEGFPNLARDKGNYFTRAAAPHDVYGELVRTDEKGVRWRRWDPYRSKLAAALEAGGVSDGLEVLLHAPSVLYLGAATGTTVSHVADIVAPRRGRWLCFDQRVNERLGFERLVQGPTCRAGPAGGPSSRSTSRAS